MNITSRPFAEWPWFRKVSLLRLDLDYRNAVVSVDFVPHHVYSAASLSHLIIT